jgi:hypothetical protein
VSEILFLHLDDIPTEDVSHLVPYTLMLTRQATYNRQCRKYVVYGATTMHVVVQIIYICVCVCVCVCVCLYTYNVYALFRENTSIYDFLIKNEHFLIKYKEVECIKIC